MQSGKWDFVFKVGYLLSKFAHTVMELYTLTSSGNVHVYMTIYTQYLLRE